MAEVSGTKSVPPPAATAEDENGVENEEDWEDVEEEDEDEEEDEAGDLDPDEVIELAQQTSALLSTLMVHPKLNPTAPQSSPKPLFQTADFVRRTYLEYIIPLLPKEAPYKSREIANPFLFALAQPFVDDPSVLENGNNWPDATAELVEKYHDAIGRNMLICMAILDQEKGQAVLGGRFDFGEHVVEIAKAIVDPDVGEREMREKYAKQGIDLSTM